MQACPGLKTFTPNIYRSMACTVLLHAFWLNYFSGCVAHKTEDSFNPLVQRQLQASFDGMGQETREPTPTDKYLLSWHGRAAGESLHALRSAYSAMTAETPDMQLRGHYSSAVDY